MLDLKRFSFLLLISAVVILTAALLTGDDSSASAEDPEVGDIFQSDTAEGVTLTYEIICTNPMYVILGDGTAHDIGDATTVTIPSTVTYSSNSFTVVIINSYAFYYCTSLTSVIIPETVQAIGDYAFEGTQLNSLTLPSSLLIICPSCFAGTNIASLTIPNSVTQIGDEAFAYCPNLTSVTLGSGVTTFGKGIFIGSPVTSMAVDSGNTNYSSSGNVIMNKAQTEIVMFPTGYDGSYTVPAGIATIDEYAFYGCSLTGVILSASVSKVSDYAFYQCYDLITLTVNSTSVSIGQYSFSETGLTELNIGTNVSYIAPYAFYDCWSLEEISINTGGKVMAYAFSDCKALTAVHLGPNATYDPSVFTIEGATFYGCTSLSTITVDPSNTDYSVLDNVLFCMGGNALVLYPAGRSGNYSIPNNVVYITNCAFAYSSITSISIPNSVYYIYYRSFSNCSELESVVIGNYVTEIGDYAFKGCTSLQSVNIPASVTSIGDYAFYDCGSLETVTGCTGVKTLGYGAFAYCLELTSISLTNTALSIDSSSSEKGVFEMCTSLETVTLPSNLTSLTYNMFYGCSSLTSLTIPSTVTSIGEGALSYTGLTSVALPSGLLSIGNYAFQNCYHLSSVTIPDCVISIGNEAFYGCSGLTSVIIGASVQQIGEYAFFQTGISSVIVPNSVVTMGAGAFKYCRSLETVQFSTAVTVIPDELFCGCSSLGSFEIRSGVTSIGSKAFYGCKGLSQILFNSTNCADLSEDSYAFGNTGPFSVIFGNGVTSVPDYLFYMPYESAGVNVVSVTVGNSVASIGEHSFQNCFNLSELIFNSNSYPGYESIADRMKYAGRDVSGGISICIGENVTSVPYELFRSTADDGSSPNITEITVGKNVTSIGSYAFAGLRNLTEFSFGATNCSSLVSTHILYDSGSSDGLTVHICDGVSLIPSYMVFENDSSHSAHVTSLYIGKDVTEIGMVAFENLMYLEEIHYNASNVNDLSSIYNPFKNCGRSGSGISVEINNVTKIPAYLFYCSESYCPKITSLTINGPSFTTIGDYAFRNLTSLTSLDTGEYVSSIGYASFRGCTSLSSITIGENVTSFGEEAFRDCTALTAIYFNATECMTSTYNGFENAGTNGSGISVVFGDGVKAVPDKIFDVYRILSTEIHPNIISVTLGKSVESIGTYAFDTCVNIQSIELPSGLKTISSYAFNLCSGLTEITIPDSVTSIGEYAFYENTSLTSITIGTGVTSIGSKAFYEATGVQQLSFNAVDCGDFSFSSDVFYKLGRETAGASVSFGPSVVDIPECIFYSSSDTVSETPNIVQLSLGSPVNIRGYSFHNCQSLTEITIPTSVRSIEYNAFDGCTYISEIHFNATECTVGWSAYLFCNAGSMTSGVSVYFGDGVLSVPDHLFNTGSSDAPKIKNIDFNNVQTIGESSFRCAPIESLSLSDTVTNVGDYAFYMCPSLTSVVLGSGVTSIGICSFSCCTSLESISVDPDNGRYVSVGGVLFDKGMKELMAYPSCKSDKEYTVPYGVKTLDCESFYRCNNLNTLIIPTTVTSTSYGAVKECTSITYITIPGSITYIGSDDFYGMVFYDIDGTTELSRSNIKGYTYKGTAYNNLIKQITMTFDTCGGSAVEPIIGAAGSPVSAPDDPSRTGYDFIKWQLNGEDYTFTVLPDDNITLTAVWDPHVISITLWSNGGETDGSAKAEYDGDISDLKAPVRTGYSVAGYYLSETSDVMVIDPFGGLKKSVEGLTDDSGKWICDSDVELCTHWAINQYDVSYVVGSETVFTDTYDYDSVVTVRDKYTETGYTIGDWPIAGTFRMPAYDVTLTATKTVNQYTVTFLNGSSVFRTGSYDYCTAISVPSEVPTKEPTIDKVFSFSHWDGYSEGMKVPAYDITFSAVYNSSLRAYSAVFMNGDAVHEIIPIGYGKAITVPSTDPVKTSDSNFRYEFTGWGGYSEGMVIECDTVFSASYMTVVRAVTVSGDRAVIPASLDDQIRLDSAELALIKQKVASGEITSLEIRLKSGSIVLDADAILSVTGESNIIGMEKVTDYSVLPSEIRTKVSGRTVYSIWFGDNHEFGGELTVSFSYDLKSGESADKIEVSYYSSDGSSETYSCQYSDGKVTFSTGHLSYYAVTPKSDSGGNSNNSTMLFIVVGVIAAALIIIAILIVIAKRRY